MKDQWTVELLSMGISRLRGPQGYWNSKWEEMVDLAFVTVLATSSDGTRVLVNTSPPEETFEVERLFPKMRYLHDVPRGDLQRTEDQRIERALAVRGLTPQDIDLVVLTPLELYTTGTLHRFTSSQIAISRRGWVHFHTMHEHAHDKRWRKFPKSTLLDLLTDGWDRVRLLDDEQELLPGLRTWWAGAHHRESIAVEFDTSEGVATVTDAFFYLDNLSERLPIGLCESLEESELVMRRIEATADFVIPIHEPKVFELYPEGIGTDRRTSEQ